MKQEEFQRVITDLKQATPELTGEKINHVLALGNYFLGVWTEKNPIDAWEYQEIISDLKPDLIIECGSFKGGSAWYLAHVMDLVGHGEIVSIELQDFGQLQLQHPRIHWLLGSTVDKGTLDEIEKIAQGKQRIMVILDSDHHEGHVFDELNLYHHFVTPGMYLIVEDTLSVYTGSKGPLPAVERFLETHTQFQVDEHRQRHILTSNLNGFLKKQ